jgi:hypothetical protein
MVMKRWIVIALGGLAALAGDPASALACPIHGVGPTRTLRQTAAEARLILYGTLCNPRRNPGSTAPEPEGTTDLRILRVLKPDPILGDQKTVTLPRYLPVDDPKNPPKFIVFLKVVECRLQPFAGFPVQSAATVDYLKEILALNKEGPQALAFFFRHLHHPNPEVSQDAFQEWANANYQDYRAAAQKLPAEKIARWLKDPQTPPSRHGLLASLLGHCGTDKHADLLRKMLDNPPPDYDGDTGVLVGYTLLKPKEGRAYMRGVLKDPSKDFMVRYRALRAARFFWESRPDVVDRKELVEGMCLLLDQGDIADIAIEDLRRWGRWEVADRVLALYDRESHDSPVVRRAIVRYALSCPKVPGVAAWIAALRRRDPGVVEDMEEVLKLEKDQPAGAPAGRRPS